MHEYEWHREAVFRYRIFARTHEDISPRFDEMRRLFVEMWTGDRVAVAADLEEILIPVKPEQVADMRDRGFLLVDPLGDGKLCVVIRGQVLTVRGDEQGATVWHIIQTTLRKTGPVFAGVSVECNALTDLVAI